MGKFKLQIVPFTCNKTSKVFTRCWNTSGEMKRQNYLFRLKVLNDTYF